MAVEATYSKPGVKNVLGGISKYSKYNVETHRAPTGKASLFWNSFAKETHRALQFSASGYYNYDLLPYQPRVLRFKKPSEDVRIIREILLEDSEFLKKHTYSLFHPIVKWGWNFIINEDPRIPEELRVKKEDLESIVWSVNEEDSFIEANSKGYVIDTAFMTKWKDGEFRVLTSNDVIRPYADDNRNLEEVYFKIGIDEPYYKRNEETRITNTIVGFLTQYSKDKDAKAQLYIGSLRSNFEEKYSDTVYKQCVVFTPQPHITNVYGKPKYKNLCATALQKFYNIFYAMLYIHKGGVHYDVVFPDDVSKNIKRAASADLRRGLLRSGLVWEVSGIGKDVGAGDILKVNATTIPPLPFMDIDYLISEESKLSQQEVKGTPESGALGGVAPQVMRDKDDQEIDELFNFMQQQILYVNELFHGVQGYYLHKDIKDEDKDDEVKINNSPIAEKIPLYIIEFNIPKPNAENSEEERQTAEDNKAEKSGSSPNKDGTPNEETPKEETSTVEVKKNQVEKHSFYTVLELEQSNVEMHAFSDYVTYTGNMLQAGKYNYPDRPEGSTRPKSIIYTIDEIHNLTKNPMNKGDIEIGHTQNPLGTRLNNIGYYEITGFNRDRDVTNFNIKKEHHAKLVKNGFIKNGKILISPYFAWELNQAGVKNLGVQNVGVIHPLHKTRASLTGLEASAIRS